MNLSSVEQNVEHLLIIFVIAFGWVQQQSNRKATANLPKSDDKNGQEMFKVVFNWSEIHSVKKYYFI